MSAKIWEWIAILFTGMALWITVKGGSDAAYYMAFACYAELTSQRLLRGSVRSEPRPPAVSPSPREHQ